MSMRAKGGFGRYARRHPRLMVALAVFGVLVALAVVRSVRGPEVEGLRVRREPLVHRVVVSGRVSPPAEVTVAARVAGTVEAVEVDEGQRVEPGQVLARLDADTLRAEVARALAAVRQSRARLTQLLEVSAPQRAEAVRQATVEREQAERALERARTLAEAGAITRAQLDDALAAVDVARSRQASAEAQAAASGRGGPEQRLAEAAVAQAEAELRAAESRLADASLTAQVPALVLRRDVEPGDSVQGGQALLRLARVGGTQLTVEPDERSLAYLRPGQPAVASADAFPRERFSARVETVAPSVDPDRGTVEVKLAVPEPPGYLRPGMTVSVDIEVGRRESALVLPTEAVRDAASERPWVLVFQDGRATRRDVVPGLRGEGTLEVVDGLSEGELVLSGKVVPGQRVRVRVRGQEG
ncbi:efflux RND transporter periplasmic adaptor subunit [Myxococcus sp. RHSTA-1-4]|uniref:efflux RND transporter periplasmic adaptor subunit n=1 Tax=Myxococcus sp. RHSTA-1-4 TaxID=2874601 RepID=UPI001CBF57E9|nr:efflux RND transporter periplasmic adaptor subunit [Myxococcus sp. RHSTA-1-4]MBZ4419576.1 efflux RND transporter periplasmic adaptor subunit [Myxococcus sp. RHSTA-1-4]